MEKLLNLSDPSKVARLLLGMFSEAERRERKLATLRGAIQAGTYRVPAERVAEAMIRSARR